MRTTICRSSGKREGGRGKRERHTGMVRCAVSFSGRNRQPGARRFPASRFPLPLPRVSKLSSNRPKAEAGAVRHLGWSWIPRTRRSRFMLVRAVRSRQRGRLIRVTATAAIAIAATRPQTLAGQEPASALPKTHTVKRGDTLWDISKTYLGDAFLWPEIYRLNTDIIEDPHWIYPGEVAEAAGRAGESRRASTPAPSAPRRQPRRAARLPRAAVPPRRRAPSTRRPLRRCSSAKSIGSRRRVHRRAVGRSARRSEWLGLHHAGRRHSRESRRSISRACNLYDHVFVRAAGRFGRAGARALSRVSPRTAHREISVRS